MAEIDYRDIPAPGLGVGAGMMRAMRRSEGPGLRVVGVEDMVLPDLNGRIPSERLQRLFYASGALASVALVIGLGLWGYKLAVRDVMGVPVIRALQGPARVAPSDPGGELARHQGLAVNAVTADGEAAPPPDRLVLAPKPADLASEDGAMAELKAETAPQPTLVPKDVAASADTVGVEPLTGQPLGADGQIIDPLTASEPIVAIPASIPGVSVSPRPYLRPGSEAIMAADAATAGSDDDAMVLAALAAASAAVTPEGTVDVDPSTLAPGTRLVQLGTFATTDEARAGWDMLASRFGAVMESKGRVIEPAGSEGQTFYRLRASGFADIADARRFCAAIGVDNTNCVPVLVK